MEEELGILEVAGESLGGISAGGLTAAEVAPQIGFPGNIEKGGRTKF